MGCCFSETDHSHGNLSHHFITNTPPPPPRPICARKTFIPKQPSHKRPSQQNNRSRRTKSFYIPNYDDYDVYFSADEFNFDNNMTDYEAAVLSASKEAEEEDRILENMFKVKFNNYDT